MKVNPNSLSNPGINPASSSALDKAQAKNPSAESAVAISAPVKPTAKGAGATVEISDEAKILKSAVEMVRGLPDDSQADKIQSLKKSIKDGTYRVDAEAISDRLVDEHLSAHFGKNSV